MIKASHHPLVNLFFRIYVHLKMKRHFNTVKVDANLQTTNNSPILLIANHISWWDGFWVLYLCRHILHKKFHFMMLENELQKRKLFSFAGGFSISPGSRQTIESLEYASGLLTNKNNLVLMFPQGKLHSIYHDQFNFQKGVERIIKHAPEAKIVFLASLFDFFDHPKPDLYFYLESYNGNSNSTSIELAYREFFRERTQRHKQMEL